MSSSNLRGFPRASLWIVLSSLGFRLALEAEVETKHEVENQSNLKYLRWVNLVHIENSSKQYNSKVIQQVSTPQWVHKARKPISLAMSAGWQPGRDRLIHWLTINGSLDQLWRRKYRMYSIYISIKCVRSRPKTKRNELFWNHIWVRLLEYKQAIFFIFGVRLFVYI